MTAYFVTRHPGAVEWARRHGRAADLVDHLDVETIRPGDTVMGTLPISLVAEVTERGARYLHLVLDLPRDLRGVALSADELDRLGARLVPYEARRRDEDEGEA